MEQKMQYIGGNQLLRGKTALIRKAAMHGRILAQFNDQSLIGQYRQKGDSGPIFYGLGWHEFDSKDFAKINDYEELSGE